MARSLIDICNQALDELPASNISALDGSNLEAQACDRHLQDVVSEMIDAHDFKFARRRVTLAQVTNDRSSEWGYAYALPNENVGDIKLVINSSSESAGVVVTPLLYWPRFAIAYEPLDYEIANGVLYTNLASAVLEYSLDVLDPAAWPPLFAGAVVQALAARIYKPILGAEASAQGLMVQKDAARRAFDVAAADDLNQRPSKREEYVSEASIARGVGYEGVVWR